MPTFILLTKISSSAAQEGLEELKEEVETKARQLCPKLVWKACYAISGPHDYLDIIEAPDIESVMTLSSIMRTSGIGVTETWPALPWQDFKSIARAVEQEDVLASV